MVAHKIEIAPETIAEGRRLYEQTLTPMQDIAAMMGICRNTLSARVREWKWTPRQIAARPFELHHAVRGAAMAAVTQGSPSEGASPAPVTPQQRNALTLRIQAAVERELAAVERVLDKINPSNPSETELAARALASISRTLREAAALNQSDPVTPPNETDDDPVPSDIDEFREALALRIEAFVAARRAADDGGVPPDAAAPVAVGD